MILAWCYVDIMSKKLNEITNYKFSQLIGWEIHISLYF